MQLLALFGLISLDKGQIINIQNQITSTRKKINNILIITMYYLKHQNSPCGNSLMKGSAKSLKPHDKLFDHSILTE